jgi:hypothetical protein
MTIGLELVLLCVLYVSVAFMVVYLIAGSALPYLLRAGLVLLVGVSFFLSWHLWRDVAGWPARAVLPEHFLFHAATIVEPDPEKSEPGSIYVWVTELRDDGPVGMPRAYRVAYLKSMHAQLQEAEARMRNGLPQVGKRKRSAEGTLSLNGVMKRTEDDQQFELGNLPSPALPEK